MIMRFILAWVLFVLLASPGEARRVALVIGQNAYPGGGAATAGLPKLANSTPDARSVAALLAQHGFDVISCDGMAAGCFDLNRAGFLDALGKLETQAHNADLAMVYFAGHGVATEEGNIVAPTDARVNCQTGAVTLGVPVEQMIAATAPAASKFLILDACRDNPLGMICPNLKGKTLSFTRIEAGPMQGLLLVTSTQFGQQALDGIPGTHSPFAKALLAAFESNPGVYFEQVMNEVARATYEAAQNQYGFLQIPGKVVGGAAPADCLTGRNCVGDPRMAALATANEQLAAEAAGTRNILAEEEKARGKPYTVEEKAQRIAQLQTTLASIGKSADPARREGRRLIDAGDVSAGTAKLDEALDADERAIAEAERIATEKRKAAAQGARDLAVLTSGRDVVKATAYYQRATRLDPADPRLWGGYAGAAVEAGRLEEARAAYEQAVRSAREAGDDWQHYWATLGLGDVASAKGALPEAHRLFLAARAIVEHLAQANPDDLDWQRDLASSHERIGDLLRAQGNLLAALDSYKATLAIADRLAKTDASIAVWQSDLAASHERIGDIFHDQGNLPAALDSYKASLAIRILLVKTDPGYVSWQRNLSVSHIKVGDLLLAQGNLPATLDSYKAALAIRDRLAKADVSNAARQRDLSVSLAKVGNVLFAQDDLPAALDSFSSSRDILDRLTKSDPSNAGWHRDLSISLDSIGNVRHAQGNLPAALDSYTAALAISDRLSRADPDNTDWQRDLSVAQEKIGNVHVVQGNLSAALDNFKTSLAIANRLAKADPGNARWQSDLAHMHGQLGMVLVRQGNREGARAAFQDGRALIEKLRALSPDNATLPKDLAWFDMQMSALGK